MNSKHMMPTTRAAHDRLLVDLEERRTADHKAAIDAYLIRWGEPPCSLDEAREYSVANAEPIDAADEIMCGRSRTTDDTLNDIAAENEAARDDEFNTWTEADQS